MARLMVTGYIDTDDLPDEHVDIEHVTGLSSEGMDAIMSDLDMLEDVKVAVVSPS